MDKTSFLSNSREAAKESGKKWFTYCKGGEFRKWYGNLEYVVNWEYDGYEVQNFRDEKTGRIRSHNYNLDYIFKPGLTFTAISSSNFACRVMSDSLFGSGGSGICQVAEEDRKPLLGVLNSKVSEYLISCLSATMNFEVNMIGSIPYIVQDEKKLQINKCVGSAINLSKEDWNSFEISWDFQHHPLLCKVPTIVEAFDQWQNECDSRFNQLKANEEELNRIFIDIYLAEIFVPLFLMRLVVCLVATLWMWMVLLMQVANGMPASMLLSLRIRITLSQSVTMNTLRMILSVCSWSS